MNQQCKVCGEPAAGFHFGAFTCEGCKSFFGRSYNNLNTITECKNNGECVINKKNRTSCKACRLRKCLRVGMSKSGSRYGRRSNWFKIHCLLQEQQQQQQQQQHQLQERSLQQTQGTTSPPPQCLSPMELLIHRQMASAFSQSQQLSRPTTREEHALLGLDEYQKNVTSPTISSPDSNNSDTSTEVSDTLLASRHNDFLGKYNRADPAIPGFGVLSNIAPPFPSLAALYPVFPRSAAHLLPTATAALSIAQSHKPYLFPQGQFIYPQIPKLPVHQKSIYGRTSPPNIKDRKTPEIQEKLIFLDAVLQSQIKREGISRETNKMEQTDYSTCRETEDCHCSPSSEDFSQDIPIDLSIKRRNQADERPPSLDSKATSVRENDDGDNPEETSYNTIHEDGQDLQRTSVSTEASMHVNSAMFLLTTNI